MVVNLKTSVSEKQDIHYSASSIVIFLKDQADEVIFYLGILHVAATHLQDEAVTLGRTRSSQSDSCSLHTLPKHTLLSCHSRVFRM